MTAVLDRLVARGLMVVNAGLRRFNRWLRGRTEPPVRAAKRARIPDIAFGDGNVMIDSWVEGDDVDEDAGERFAARLEGRRLTRDEVAAERARIDQRIAGARDERR